MIVVQGIGVAAIILVAIVAPFFLLRTLLYYRRPGPDFVSSTGTCGQETPRIVSHPVACAQETPRFVVSRPVACGQEGRQRL